MVNLTPISLTRGSRRRYSSLPTRDLTESPNSPLDSAERRYDIDYTPTQSPQQAGQSQFRCDSQPLMLRLRKVRRTQTSQYHLPNRIIRYLCFTMILTVFVFIVSLYRMSVDSSRLVTQGERKLAMPPPPWRDFPFLNRYMGGIRALISWADNRPEYPRDVNEEWSFDDTIREVPHSDLFNPYPEYSSAEYLASHMPVKECFLDTESKIRIPPVRTYNGTISGMPNPAMGSHDVLGIRSDVCFDRLGRLGPYGFGYSAGRGGSGIGQYGEQEGADDVWRNGQVDWRGINWGKIQSRCAAQNTHRFQTTARASSTSDPIRQMIPETKSFPNEGSSASGSQASQSTPPANLLTRSAFVIRTYTGFDYTPESVLYLRSIISELSLLSSGEYTIHILIHVRDSNLPIWASPALYRSVLESSIPEEFWGLSILWSEPQMGLIYSGLQDSMYRNLPVHGVYRSTYMALTWFAQQHPEYAHFWQWEMDARYTGHWYDLISHLSNWAKEQPRKLLWERNARFYVPSVHGSWEDFKQMVRVQTMHGTSSTSKPNLWAAKDPFMAASSNTKGETPVWGPLRPRDPSDWLAPEADTTPPMTFEKDNYEWGVGEDADLLSLSPLFDPAGTTWKLTSDVTGYIHNTTHPLPRRAAIITAGRLSKKLLNLMHEEMVQKHHTLFSEMHPATVALHHGLKAVSAPHPIYVDRQWPPRYLASVFNAGRNGASGGSRTSVFGDREHNFKGVTWFYNAEFASVLWKRWLGMRVNNDVEGEEGRMCLPALLVHPVKEVAMHAVDEVEEVHENV